MYLHQDINAKSQNRGKIAFLTLNFKRSQSANQFEFFCNYAIYRGFSPNPSHMHRLVKFHVMIESRF